MNTNVQDRQDTRLRTSLTSAYPSADPSDVFKRRVQEETARHADVMLRRVQRQRRVRLGLAYVCLAVFVAVALIVRPRIVAAQELARIQSAINDAKSAHSVEWRVEAGGKRVKEIETWFQAGQWHIERWGTDSDKRPDIEICADGGHWRYNTYKNTVTYDREPQPTGLQFMSGFSLGATVKDAARIGVLMDVREEEKTVVNGREIRHFVIHDNKYPSFRSLIGVDAQTDLPVIGESQAEQNGRWVTVSAGETQYNDLLPIRLFRPDFPKTARLIDQVSGRAIWEQRLAKGIVTKQIADTSLVYPQRLVNGQMMRVEEMAHQPRMLVIRDLQVNRGGDVFLLFTAGDSIDIAGAKAFGSAELEDDSGTKYLPDHEPSEPGAARLIATCRDADGNGGSGVDGYMFRGEPLEATWWVPVNPPRTPWKPRRFRLTFKLDGPVSANENTLEFPIQKPEADIMPDYMPYMARPLYEVSIQTGEALRRAYYYRDQRHDLARSLFWFRQTIVVMREDDLKTRSHYDASIEWFAIYQILAQLGRANESKAALIHANEDAVYASPTRDQIRSAMDRIGLKP